MIDAGIAQYLMKPPVSQAIRATLRHAILAACFEHGRAIRIGRLAELLSGSHGDLWQDEVALLSALDEFIRERSAAGPVDDKIRQAVADEVSRQMSELKIVRGDAQ